MLLVIACPAFVAASPYRFGGGPDAKKNGPAPENRAKLIEEIRSDFNDAVDKLNQNDPGAQTRARQERILANLKKLLENDDPPPPPSSSNNSNSPKPINPPSDPTNPEPKPMTNDQTPSPLPRPQPKSSQNNTPEPKPMATDSSTREQRESPPRTLEELQKARPDMKGYWPDPRRSALPEMDAIMRQRFPRGYEELLREYYRSLAESARRDD
jgi:hypothetical protein